MVEMKAPSFLRVARAPRSAARFPAVLCLACVMSGCGLPATSVHRDLATATCQQIPPTAKPGLTVRFLGTTSLLLQDGDFTILSDGFVSRPGLLRVLLRKIEPDEERVRSVLECLNVSEIDAVFTNHSHYDHAMDAPVFARMTGAQLIGSKSTVNVGRGQGLPEHRMGTVQDGDTVRIGNFLLTFIESTHSPNDREPGTIDRPLVPPARKSAWKTGTVWSVLILHRGSNILIHGSAGFKRGALKGRSADVVYLGIAELAKQSEAAVDDYWNEVVRATGARRVFLVHWDDFFRSINEPLQPLPRAAGSFSKAVARVRQRALRDGVEVLIPSLWTPVDPLAGLR